MEKISLDSLIIEITRKCNMTCEHCMRGDAQNIDIKKAYIDSLFSQIDFVHTITLTGGEPALKPELIQYTIDSAKKYDVEIANFYIATNGKLVSDEFIKSIMNLWFFCTDNDLSRVDHSNDTFHHEADQRQIRKLKVFGFFGKKFGEDNYNYHNHDFLINAGNCNFGSREEKHPELTLDISTWQDNNTIDIETMIYLNAEGNIILDCDMSYDSQDYNIYADVDDLNHKIMNQYELECKEEEEEEEEDS